MSSNPRKLDHIVLPVTDLDTARARYQALGFVVNKDGIHPFGTANCCVFFGDDTYFEPLAIRDNESYIRALADKNSFIMLDKAYRAQIASEGVSALSLKSDDVEADDDMFKAKGCATRNPFAFERTNVNAEGKETLLSVKGSFCVREELVGAPFFTIEWLGDPDDIKAIRSAPDHPNGVLGVRRVTYHAPDPQAAAEHFELASNTTAQELESRDGLRFATNGFELEILKNGNGDTAPLKITQIDLAIKDRAEFMAILEKNAVEFDEIAEGISVHPAPGQGVILRFVS